MVTPRSGEGQKKEKNTTNFYVVMAEHARTTSSLPAKPSVQSTPLPPNASQKTSLFTSLALYLSRQADNPGRYLLEQLVYFLFGWVPTLVGIGLRGVFYRLILKMDGWAAIENNVRLRFANHIRLGAGAYLDQGVYLHACPAGIEIGANTIVMHGAVLHVYNFRGLPHAGIHIGQDSLIGEYTIIRGQGGVSIGDRVYTSPFTQLLAVNHIVSDPRRPFIEQGITAQGITVEDDVWLGANTVITDGVRIGQGAVVAAGAVVTHDVPAHTVVAGIPARVIRQITPDDPPPGWAGLLLSTHLQAVLIYFFAVSPRKSRSTPPLHLALVRSSQCQHYRWLSRLITKSTVSRKLCSAF